MPILTVLLVDDDKHVLRAWKRALKREGHDVHSAASFEEAVRLLTDLATVHVALLDMRLPCGSGETLHDLLIRVHPSAGAAVVSAHFDEDTRRRLESRKIRIQDKPLARLPQLVEDLWPGPGPHPRSQSNVMEIAVAGRLTPRETQVFRLLAAGLNTEDIAGYLHLSRITVKTHEQHIREKIGHPSKAELLAAILRIISWN